MRHNAYDKSSHTQIELKIGISHLNRISFDSYVDLMKSRPYFNLLKEVVGETVLDVGCSGSWMTYLLKDGRKIFGVDILHEAVEYSRKHNPAGYFQVVDINEGIPFSNNFFDSILVLGGTFEHIYDHTLFLQECRRVLKAGGNLIVTELRLGLPIEDTGRVLAFDSRQEAIKWFGDWGFDVRDVDSFDENHVVLVCKPVSKPKTRKTEKR